MEPTTATTTPTTNTTVVETGNKTRTILIIVAVVVLALGLVAFLIYRSGKKKGQQQGSVNLSSPLATDGSAPSASEEEIKRVATNLHDDMDGLNITGHNEGQWNDLLAMSDSDFIRVNNYFNTTYQADSEESFRQWVEGESSTNFNAKEAVILKMNKLNIK